MAAASLSETKITGEPRGPLCLHLYMEDIAYLRATEWWCYGNIECLHPPSTDVNTWPHYAGKEMKDHRVELADEKTVCVYDYGPYDQMKCLHIALSRPSYDATIITTITARKIDGSNREVYV